MSSNSDVPPPAASTATATVDALFAPPVPPQPQAAAGVAAHAAVTTTTNAQQQPHQQQQRSATVSVPRPAKNENAQQWLERVRNVQLQVMTPEQRAQLEERGRQVQAQREQAREWHGMSMRQQAAKTSTYVAMSNASAVPLFSGSVARPFPGGSSAALTTGGVAAGAPAAPPPAMPSGARGGGGFFSFFSSAANAPAQPQQAPPAPQSDGVMRERHAVLLAQRAPTSATEQAKVLMDAMEDDDEDLAMAYGSRAAPRRNAKRSAGGAARVGSSDGAPPSDDSDDDMPPPPPAVVDQAANFAAARSEAMQMRSAAVHFVQSAARAPLPTVADVTVTESEEQKALRSLEYEPGNDEERAAKFLVFEAFSAKVFKLRTELDALVARTVAELPPLPADSVRRSMRVLDDDRARGINDQSRYWFVHQMFVQVARNCDTITGLSEDVARKVRLAANSADTECPVCLNPYTDGAGLDEGCEDDAGDGDERVTKMLLGCCHSICRTCYARMTELGMQLCPLCRGTDFVEAIQHPQPVAH